MPREIDLSSGIKVLVDDDDYERISSIHWHETGRGYICRFVGSSRHGVRRKIYLHREIIQAPVGVDVDHINGNRLDNRKDNLRLATRSQNLMNRDGKPGHTSKYKGVNYCKITKQWAAKITVSGEIIWLGRFGTEDAAARAYNAAASKFHGHFARLNQINED